ncbi:DUF6037 family protein [Paenibacillus nicotianae]|uniref:DUF6037 family protein n=1 Tax=Paenibacillus nicotianae TaxID=1526551 RepID=A0ABW4UQJ7_9BACL
MVNTFENLKLLKQDMKSKGWVIDSFYFNYKKQNYIVLVKLFEKNENFPEYALLKLEFLKENNFSDILVVYANSSKLLTDAKTLREYFGIEYSSNLGDILLQFSRELAKFIPEEVSDNKNEHQKEAMCRSLSKSDLEDPEKKYCFYVKRNPVKKDNRLGQRSPFNDNKTRLYRPSLYERLGADTNLSFCYSTDLDQEETDENIIIKWTIRKNK